MIRAALIALTMTLALAGCNTVAGMGADISNTANTVGGWFGG